jgi:replicative DNA helicase
VQQSDLIILAGRPGMGKTALATNIAYNVAKAWRGEMRADGHMATLDGGIVGFFSLEMSAEQLATRIIGEQTGIPANRIRRGDLKEGDYEKIKQVSTELQDLPLCVDQTGGLSIGQVAARARRLKRQRGLDLLVIDYLQLLQTSKRSGRDNRVQEITEITTSLKALAKELTFRSSRCHSCRGRWSSAIINDPNSPICASPAQLSRTPMSCCSCFVRPTTTRCKSPMMTRNSPLGRVVPKSFITVLRLLLQNTVTGRPQPSN